MGAAAYNRGSKRIRQSIAADDRPAEFSMMDDLNALLKHADAGTPFGPLVFVKSHNGWWAECPETGFGYRYSSLREAVRSWRVHINGYRDGSWMAVPIQQLCDAA